MAETRDMFVENSKPANNCRDGEFSVKGMPRYCIRLKMDQQKNFEAGGSVKVFFACSDSRNVGVPVGGECPFATFPPKR